MIRSKMQYNRNYYHYYYKKKLMGGSGRGHDTNNNKRHPIGRARCNNDNHNNKNIYSYTHYSYSYSYNTYCYNNKNSYYHTDATLEWAKQNPAMAQACLNPPKWTVPKNQDFSNTKTHLLEDYCQWRRWPHSSPIKSTLHEKAMSISSHTLSAPLTMACFYSSIEMMNKKKKKLLSQNQQEQQQTTTPTRLCCVGARAEATLPLEYWKEFLLLSSSLCQTSIMNVSLDFLGPDVKTTTPDTIVSLDSDIKLGLSWYFSGFRHEKRDETWDAYILFNPGLGHDNLINDWRPTLEMIVNEKKPVLLTAHSTKDAERDSERLLREYDLNVQYSINPFASRITYEDPFDPGHIVRPNQFVTCIFGVDEES